VTVLIGHNHASVADSDDHQMATVGRLQDLLAENLSGRTVSDELAVEAEDFVKPFDHTVEIVGGDDHGLAGIP
jgi:hypothetical protein